MHCAGWARALPIWQQGSKPPEGDTPDGAAQSGGAIAGLLPTSGRRPQNMLRVAGSPEGSSDRNLMRLKQTDPTLLNPIEHFQTSSPSRCDLPLATKKRGAKAKLKR